jgi:hypothetical protein
MAYTLIDPQVSSLSTIAEVDAWLAELAALEPDDGVRLAIVDAHVLRAETAAREPERNR